MELKTRKGFEKYALKVRSILDSKAEVDLTVKPWNPRKIKELLKWYGNNEVVQEIISNYYKISK